MGTTTVGLVFEIVMFIAIFYIGFILPQQRRQKKRDEVLKNVKRGDEIVTAGGIVGEVVHIRETNKDGGANRMDDRITIKSAESRFVIERGKIERVVGATAVTTASNNPPT
ncbi:MAG TPA: preprotein translocase subunit YajC [Gemmatimonadaceae bacterium]